MPLHCWDCGGICVKCSCAPCEVLNPIGIEIYCEKCEKHPLDFIENRGMNQIKLNKVPKKFREEETEFE